VSEHQGAALLERPRHAGAAERTLELEHVDNDLAERRPAQPGGKPA
jgi:hypothetical protein